MDDPRTPAEQPPSATDAGPGSSTPSDDAAEGSDGSEPAAGAAAAAPADAAPATRRSRFYLRGRRPRLPRSRRGIFALLMIVSGLGLVGAFSAVSLIQWTETADFCGRCHTMSPELAAYEAGPHKEVACAECHVEPGITGWIKAKINGTKQLVSRSRRPTMTTCPRPPTPASAATTSASSR